MGWAPRWASEWESAGGLHRETTMPTKRTPTEREELKRLAERHRAIVRAIRAGRPEHLRPHLEELARVRREYVAAAQRHRRERGEAREATQGARADLRAARANWPGVKRAREASARAILLQQGGAAARDAEGRLAASSADLHRVRGEKERRATEREAALWGTPKWGTCQARKAKAKAGTLRASEFRQVARDSFLSRVEGAGGDVRAAERWAAGMTTEAKRRAWLKSPAATRGKWGPDYWGERLWELWEEDEGNRGASSADSAGLDEEYRRWAEEQQENAEDLEALPGYHPQANTLDLAEWLEEFDE